MVRIDYSYNTKINALLKSFGGIRWSRTHSCFYLPNRRQRINDLFEYLTKKGFWVDYEAIRYLKAEGKSLPKVPPQLSPENQERLKKYRSYLKGLRLSTSTVNCYGYFILHFLRSLSEKRLEKIDSTYVQQFVQDLVADRKYGISSHRQLISALKHFSDLFVNSKIDNLELVRPRRSRYLPTVLSQEEIIRLLQGTTNLKHRTIIALIYSSGLRISELLNLKLMDIDLNRKQIRVYQSKGRKDRYVVLADSFIPLLLNYLNSYQPKHFFVEGDGGIRYSDSSVRAFLRRNCRKVGILKRVTPHTLRHSYATHLVENGVNLRHVQELLGHAKPETTMIYTHVARRDLLNIRSPLDDAILKLTKTDNKSSHIRLSGDI